MAVSKWPHRFGGLSVFIGFAIGTWVVVVGLTWVGERLSTSVQTQVPASLAGTAASAGERAKSNTAARRVWEGTHYETPDQAVPNLAKISDPIARNDALHSVASVWLSKKPEEFAKFADEASRTGDPLWIRAMADTLVDWKDQGVRSVPQFRQHLSAEVLQQLREDIASQSFPGSSDNLLKALEAE